MYSIGTWTCLKSAGIAGFSAVLLAACATGKVESLNSATLSGDAYRDSLATNYAELAKYEYEQMYDGVDAGYFADKGMTALKGGEILPEEPRKWNISNREMMGDLEGARLQLIAALNNGAAAKLPSAAARAVVSYDCWVEQAEEGWQYRDIQGCREGFKRAMATIDSGMAAPVAAVQQEKPAPAPMARATSGPDQYLLFFDWDSAELDGQARDIVRVAVENARKSEAKSLLVVGHADRSGPRDYNQRLSVQRAQAVADRLRQLGYGTDSIRLSGRGEEEPLVATGDGVREPQNRRVHILFADRRPGS